MRAALKKRDNVIYLRPFARFAKKLAFSVNAIYFFDIRQTINMQLISMSSSNQNVVRRASIQ
jgi:hypothetical protein